MIILDGEHAVRATSFEHLKNKKCPVEPGQHYVVVCSIDRKMSNTGSVLISIETIHRFQVLDIVYVCCSGSKREFSQANNGGCDLYEGCGLQWQAGQRAAIRIRSVQLEVTDVFLSKCYVCLRKMASFEDIVEIPRHSLSPSQRAQELLIRWRLS
jgi:hypothetical protein